MYPMEHIWTILMLKILQAHLSQAFVENLKIDAIYALNPESFCDKNLAVRKVFAFSDSAVNFATWERQNMVMISVAFFHKFNQAEMPLTFSSSLKK